LEIRVPGEDVTLDGCRVGLKRLDPPRDLLLALGAGETLTRPSGIADLARPTSVPIGRQALRERDEQRSLCGRNPLEKLAENQGDIGWLRLRGGHGRLRCQFLPGRIHIGAEPKQMGGRPYLAANVGADDTELERRVGATDGLSLAACAEPVISVRCLGHTGSRRRWSWSGGRWR